MAVKKKELKGKEAAKANYKHYVPEAVRDPKWMEKYNFCLVESMEDLKSLFSKWQAGRGFIAFDTETTGLDPETCELVGYSFCIDGTTGYYVAVNHFDPAYNLGEEAVQFIYDRMCESKKTFMFNSRFDCRILEYRGFNPEVHANQRLNYIKYDMSKVDVYDVSVACWLADTNIKMPSLKSSALHFLGYDMVHFEEALGEETNFKFTDPKNAALYAGADALCTYLLVPITMRYYKESGLAGELDQRVAYPLQHYEREKIFLDREALSKIVEDGQKELLTLEKEIYDSIGYAINLNSPAQVSEAFSRMGIDTGKKTATGFMATGMKDLESLPEEIRKQYPTLDKFVSYKTLFKLISSYAKVLLKEANGKGYIRCNYKTQQVPTGRLASGKDSKNTFFSPLNVQSIPKPHVSMYYVFDLGDRKLFDRSRNILMGYEFTLAQYGKNTEGKKELIIPESTETRKYMGLAEGMNPSMNLRATFLPTILGTDNPNDFVFVNIDYSAQELRIPANLSGEPTWVTAFTSGGDVHRSTAEKIWGKEKYNKDYRKMAKVANFSILYGAGAESFCDNPTFNMNLEQARQFYDDYKKALPTLFQWVDRKQAEARRAGTAYTHFGRPRRVKGYFENRQIAFGNRTIVNTCIQGLASDMLKLVLVKLWKKILDNPEYKNDVSFAITVHDEIDYKVRTERAAEIGRLLEKSMTISLPDFPVTIAVELSMGWAWGSVFAMEWTDDESYPDGGYYTPKLD